MTIRKKQHKTYPWDSPADLDPKDFTDVWTEGEDGVPYIQPEVVKEVAKQFPDKPAEKDGKQ